MMPFWSVVTRRTTSLQKVPLRTMRTYNTHNQDSSGTENRTPIEGEAPRERNGMIAETSARSASNEDTMSTETLHTDSSIDSEHDDYVRTAYPFIYFDERDKYGQLTGCTYVRHIECGCELPTGTVMDSGFDHEPYCSYADAEERDKVVA